MSVKVLAVAYLKADQESTLFKILHVTDTDKKIDQLDTKIDQLRTDMYAKFDKTDAKLDSNFNHINLRLDQAFNRPQKEKDV